MDLRKSKFFNSIRTNDFHTFFELLEEGFDIDCFEYDSRNTFCPLCLACHYCRKEMVEELLKRGSLPDGNCKINGDSNCPIRCAIGRKNINIIKLLILAGADYNYKLTKDQINIEGRYYGTEEEITFWSDLEKFKITPEEIKLFIGGLNRKGAVRE